jgi:hypothetical protein
VLHTELLVGIAASVTTSATPVRYGVEIRVVSLSGGTEKRTVDPAALRNVKDNGGAERRGGGRGDEDDDDDDICVSYLT